MLKAVWQYLRNFFRSVLEIDPIGLMSALEQSYFVKYPRKLKSETNQKKCKTEKNGTKTITSTFHRRLLCQEPASSPSDPETTEGAERTNMTGPFVGEPKIDSSAKYFLFYFSCQQISSFNYQLQMRRTILRSIQKLLSFYDNNCKKSSINKNRTSI